MTRLSMIVGNSTLPVKSTDFPITELEQAALPRRIMHLQWDGLQGAGAARPGHSSSLKAK